MADRRNPERVAWLKKNRAVWQGYRLTDRTVESIHGMMQVAGLYAFTTHWYDSAWRIATIIRDIRTADRKKPTCEVL